MYDSLGGQNTITFHTTAMVEYIWKIATNAKIKLPMNKRIYIYICIETRTSDISGIHCRVTFYVIDHKSFLCNTMSHLPRYWSLHKWQWWFDPSELLLCKTGANNQRKLSTEKLNNQRWFLFEKLLWNVLHCNSWDYNSRNHLQFTTYKWNSAISWHDNQCVAINNHWHMC